MTEADAKPRGWRAQARAFLRQLAAEHTQPGRVAVGLVVGAMIGCTPLFGLHILVCIAVAWLLGLNQLIVYGAANLSIPPLVPIVGFLSVQAGEHLLHGHWAYVTRAEFHAHARQLATRYFVDWMVGGLALGALVGGVGGLAFYVAATLRSRRRPGEVEWRALVAAATEKYRGLPPRFYWYARMKYRLDPCYRAVMAEIAPQDFTVDLGTGLGMLPVLLGLQQRRALGVEWDAAKTACGQHAARDLPGVEILGGDLRQAALSPCDVITLVDVLHYYDAPAQSEILLRCKNALRSDGKLLIREGDGAQRGGAGFTRLVERAMVRLGWNRAPDVRFRPVADLARELREMGFAVEVKAVAGQLHPGNVLLVAQLRAGRS